MIGAIGTFFQVAGQIGQAIHAVKQAVDGDGEDGQDAAAAAGGNAVQRSIETTGADGKRVVVTRTTRPDGSVVTRRDAVGGGVESFSSILAAVASRGGTELFGTTGTAGRLAAPPRSAGALSSGRVDISI